MQRGVTVALLLAFAATSADAYQARGRSGGGQGGRPSGGRGGGGHSMGGHVSGGRSWSRHVSAGRSSGARVTRGYSTGARARGYSTGARGYSTGARVTRGYSTGARYASGGATRGYYGGGRAVPRGSIGQPPRSGAQYRHPRPGYGTGYSYGRGYGYGNRYYGSGNHGYRSYGYRNYGYGYGRGYYGRYPYYYGYSPYYYGYSPYYYGYSPYGLGLGLSFSFGGGYVSGYYAPQPSGYVSVSDESYQGGGSVRGEDVYDRDEPRDDGRAEAGELQLTVLPEDASVWIDGEFRGAARAVERVALPLGRHQIEVVRPGFRTATRVVDVQRGSTASVHIELTRP